MSGYVRLPRWLLICLGAGAVALVFFRPGGLRSVGPYAAFLLCPLMHILMMGHMGHGHDHKDETGGEAVGSCHGGGPARKETTREESA